MHMAAQGIKLHWVVLSMINRKNSPPTGRGEARREEGGGKLTDYNGAVADLTELLKLDPTHA